MTDRVKRLMGKPRKPPIKPSVKGVAGAARFSLGLTVGIGISAESVRAVGVTGDAIHWAIELERSESEPLADTLTALIERCPFGRSQSGRGSIGRWRIGVWPRPRVMVAIGPAVVQVKRLTGLPPLTDIGALEALVREGAGRFFLRNGVPLITTGVRLVGPGTAWAAAFEAPVVEQIERACHTADLRLRAIVPTAAALAHAIVHTASDEQMVWTDGAIRTELTFSKGRIASARRLSREPAGDGDLAEPEKSDQPSLVATLERLGQRSLAFADAYGATRVARDDPLSIRSGSAVLASSTSRKLPRARIAIASSAFLLAAVGATTGPSMAAIHTAHGARTRLRSIDKEVLQASNTERELGRVSGALGEVARFESSRRSTTMLLADLTNALPKETALVALQVDTVGGTLVALSARAAQVTTALEKVKQIASPEIVGPVTREAVGGGGRAVERVTVRFRFAR